MTNKMYYNKYLKYKNKYNNLKGGFLQIDDIYNNITSIGFEFETTDLKPFYGSINGDTLKLTPFGFNEYSQDSTQNRSLEKIKIKDIKSSNSDITGQLILSQDSYVIINDMPNNSEMDKNEALTIGLDSIESTRLGLKSKNIYDLNMNDTIKKIKFDINIQNNLTIGNVEFMCTYLNLLNIDNKTINKMSDEIMSEIINLFTDKKLTFIGVTNLEFNRQKKTDGIIFIKQLIESEQYNVFKFNDYNVRGMDIYLLSTINETKNINKHIKFGVQMTIGTPIKQLHSIINTISIYGENNNAKAFYNTHYKYIKYKNYKSFIHDLVVGTDYENNIYATNFLLLLSFYILHSDYKAYNIKRDKDKDKVEIHKFYIPILPRQNFYEIVNKNKLQELFKVININKVLFFCLNKMRECFNLSTISKNTSREYTLEDINIELINHYFSDLTLDDIKIYDFNDLEQIKNDICLILSKQILFFKVFNPTEDIITTFTTKIPYDGEHIIFELREIERILQNSFYNNFVKLANNLHYDTYLSYKLTNKFNLWNNVYNSSRNNDKYVQLLNKHQDELLELLNKQIDEKIDFMTK